MMIFGQDKQNATKRNGIYGAEQLVYSWAKRAFLGLESLFPGGY